MRRLATTFFLVFITWLMLTFTLEPMSIATGLAVSLIITIICRHLLSPDTPRVVLHPKRWAAFIAYLAVMVYAEALAHWDVAKRVFTGNIRPAIIEVPVGFKTPLGRTLFGNSITLTPGTLTVNAQKQRNFYIHTIGYQKGKDIGHVFRRFGTKVIS